MYKLFISLKYCLNLCGRTMVNCENLLDAELNPI